MRPPDLPGGNPRTCCRRRGSLSAASMRPPDLPGGNVGQDGSVIKFLTVLQ